MNNRKIFTGICILASFLLLMGCDDLQSILGKQEDTTTSYTVTFESNGGSAVAQASVESEGKVTKPADPTKADNTFQGWYKESNFVTAWDFATDTVSQNITLYAKWSGAGIFLHFNANGGTGSFASIQFNPGEIKELPFMDTQITRTGYKFISWNTVADRAGGTEYRQRADVTLNDASLTLYAQWVKLYNLGDPGPGGGLVFYSKFDWEDVSSYPEWVYMEAAPASEEAEKKWGGNATPNTSEGIGQGFENTNIITASFDGDYAAHYCQNLIYGGFDDWYLPSRPELALICDILYRNNLGNFTSKGVYWSSSEKTLAPETHAFVIIFDLDLYNPLTMVNPQLKTKEFRRFRLSCGKGLKIQAA